LFIINSQVVEKKELKKNIFLIKIYSPKIANVIEPGQFLNIRVSNDYFPLLRRPFSVCDVEDENIFVMFNIVGEGTKILADKSTGDKLDIIGPLGNGFKLNDDFETAVIVAGGLGSAPFPFVTQMLKGKNEIMSFVGGRTNEDVVTYGLENVHTASDDGSAGYKGTVIDLLQKKLDYLQKKKIKIFGCGPTQMLRALQNLCSKTNINCEISTECAMACGFGICQGCPVESATSKEKYLLVCKDGPVFNAKDVII
jgi:dihydroorotate dehydrogenase electron transfer subunit